jgi:hypothetical protein
MQRVPVAAREYMTGQSEGGGEQLVDMEPRMEPGLTLSVTEAEK